MATVLIVDDEKGLRITLSRFVEYEGHKVLLAEDAQEAENIIKNNDIDIVVSDIIMPKVSGVDLLKMLATNFPTIKVILITGEPTLNTASEALRAGAFDYLSKPISKANFLKVISTAVKLKKLEDEKRNYRKNLENEVQARTNQLLDYSRRMKHIAENIKHFSSCKNVDELCASVMMMFAENMNSSGGSLYFKENDSLKLMHAQDATHQPNIVNSPFVENSVLKRLYENKTGFIVEDINKETKLLSSGWPNYRSGSLLAIPLLEADGTIFGTVTLHDKKIETFTVQDLEVGQIIAANFMESLKTIELSKSLRTSERKYRELAEQSRTGIFVHKNEKLIYANSRLLEMIGYKTSDLPQILDSSIFDFIPESDLEIAHKTISDRLKNIETPSEYELRLKTKDGNTIWTDTSISIIEHNGSPAIMGNVFDITEKKLADAERERLETELQHAQKMEAIGRLAGGVAHDFNNLLTGITGNISLALLDLKAEDPLAKTLNEINAISKRAANLTRQLLAFSRKQIIEPKIINLNNRISDLHKMLVRIIGEDIILVNDLQKDLGQVKVDPSQVEQIIVNLSVNARDAMPNGGQLLLATENVIIDENSKIPSSKLTPGTYVKLSVKDNGTGMNDEILSRLFEPFFTTKPKDKGTGLGLSTVYGIVRQHGGYIDVESEVGKGTKFTIYFLQVEGKSSEFRASNSASDWPKGTETILLVEDELIVRNMTSKILSRLGYKVLKAPNGGEGLSVGENNSGKIDLLLTDVVMPGMNGPELAERLAPSNPEMTILFTSGYTNEDIIHHGIKDQTVNFISKPYTPQELSHKIRKVLEK